MCAGTERSPIHLRILLSLLRSKALLSSTGRTMQGALGSANLGAEAKECLPLVLLED